MGTLTVYSSTSDAWLYKYDNDYTTAHDAASGTAWAVPSTIEIGQENASGLDKVRRGGLYFDTSALPDDAVISAAILTLYRAGGTATQAFNFTIVNGDDLADPAVATNYGDLLDDTTALANVVDTDTWTLNTSKDFTLTSAGRAKISLIGTTKFGLRSSRDITPTPPADGVDEDVIISCGRETETAKKPKLVITYTRNPTVTTQAVSSINGRTAVGNGNVTDLGSPNPTQHGHCWSTSANPTTADTKTMLGAKDATGAFTSDITGLALVTGYHVRAYVVGGAGTFYGADVSFTSAGVIYPTDAISRVTNLIHRYNRALGEYTLEMALGEVTSDFGLPEWLGKPVSALAAKEIGEREREIDEAIRRGEEEAEVRGVREVSIQEEKDRLRRTAEDLERRREEEERKRKYDLEQEIEKFKRLRPTPEPTPPVPTTPEMEAEKRAIRRKAEPPKPPPPKVRPVSIEEEKAKFRRLRGG